jgi:hypothetical protein
MSGCGLGIEVNTNDLENTKNKLWDGIVSSAVSPAGSGQLTDNIEKAMEQVVEKLNELAVEEAIKQNEINSKNPDLIFRCKSSILSQSSEIPLLACTLGQYVNDAIAHVIFWYDQSGWKAQIYPQVEDVQLQKERETYFRKMGENCPVGCAGGFKDIREQDGKVMIVVNLASTANRGVNEEGSDEVHLLELDHGKWRILWAPSPGTYHYGDVILDEKGFDRFKVSHLDGTVDNWILTDDHYVKEK